jgi:hypothetical protein
MSTLLDLVLLTTDPATGKSKKGSAAPDAVLGGAVLLDLVAAGAVRLEGEGKKARVVVADPSTRSDPEVEAGLARLRDRKPGKAQNVVTRLGKKARAAAYDALTASGRVRPREEEVLGLFPVTRHDVVDVAGREALVAAVRDVLLDDVRPDDRTGPLVSLLHAGDLLGVVVDRPDRKRAKDRADEVSRGDWAAQGVRDAIASANAAIMAAVIAGSAAASAGGSGGG